MEYKVVEMQVYEPTYQPTYLPINRAILIAATKKNPVQYATVGG